MGVPRVGPARPPGRTHPHVRPTRRRGRAPPSDIATVRTELTQLTIAPEGDMAGYSRREFPHWATEAGECNTRETVLKRDGTNVVTNDRCAAVSGTWVSPYDGGSWAQASDVDIDHMVPLAQAWRSGANEWTRAQRQAFANDLTGPQLWTVTDNVNQAKGDKDPTQWQPPLTSFRCTYARAWIDVKSHYHLTADPAEQAALQRMLDTYC